MPVPDYDKTLVGRYIRAIENPDSIGFKNGRWYQSSRRGDDPNNRGFGIDVKYNKDAVKQTRGRKGFWLSEEEERALRNKHIDYSLGVVDRNTPKILKQPPSENKRAVAAGLIYRGDGKKTIIDNPTLRDTYYTGTDEDFQKAVADYYKQKGITERARKHSEFLKTNVSKPEEKPSWESFGKFTQRTFSDVGPLTAYKSWEDLSMREKAEMMKVAVRNGITDLGSIKAEYNEFAKGGPKSTGISGNAQKAMSYFMGKGLSRDQAAGLVGNLMRESTLNPTAVNKGSGAYGLAQWLGSRKKALFTRYGNAPTFDQQLDFIWHELNTTHKNGLRHLKNSKGFSDAASNAFGYYEFSAGPQGAVQAMNKSRQDGLGALNKGIRFASQLMGQPVPKQAWYKGTGNVQMPEMVAEIPVPEVEFMPSNPEVFFGYNDQGGSPVYPVSYQQPFITFDELPASATEAQKVDIRKLEEQERKRNLYNMMGFLGKMYGSLDNGNSKGETNIFDAIGNLTGYKPFHEFRKGGKKEGITDEEYYNRMERVAQENYRQWGFDSPTDALVHALNDNTYDYRGFYNENPDSSADADTHWPDTYKTVWHPTFSRESKYSGKMSDYNPKGLEGGSWIGDTFIPSWWQRDVKAMGGNLFGDGGDTKAGMPVTYYPAEDVMPVVADNMDKSIVLDDVVVTPSRKIPMQSDLFEGVTNQAANERADEFANRTSLTPGRFLGLMGVNIPLAAGALGATVAAPAVFDSTIAPLSDYVAGTKAGQTITGLLGNPYFNTAVEAGFAGHGLNHAINEGIDGWGDAAMTAMELTPLGELAKPVWNASKEGLQYTAKVVDNTARYVSPSYDLYRTIVETTPRTTPTLHGFSTSGLTESGFTYTGSPLFEFGQTIRTSPEKAYFMRAPKDIDILKLGNGRFRHEVVGNEILPSGEVNGKFVSYGEPWKEFALGKNYALYEFPVGPKRGPSLMATDWKGRPREHSVDEVYDYMQREKALNREFRKDIVELGIDKLKDAERIKAYRALKEEKYPELLEYYDTSIYGANQTVIPNEKWNFDKFLKTPFWKYSENPISGQVQKELMMRWPEAKPLETPTIEWADAIRTPR